MICGGDMISYSPNFMGPAWTGWYEKYDIPYTIEMYENKFIEPTGEMVERKHYEQYAGGRIDIYCDEPWQELGCPIMRVADWNKLHDFCDEFESEKQLREFEFFAEFEKYLGREMDLAPSEDRDMFMKENYWKV
jgi:hypothetical protein